jgi:hypothetical protein
LSHLYIAYEATYRISCKIIEIYNRRAYRNSTARHTCIRCHTSFYRRAT